MPLPPWPVLHLAKGDPKLEGRSFPILVLDEATQATEPSSLIPVMAARVGGARIWKGFRGMGGGDGIVVGGGGGGGGGDGGM